MMIAHMRIEEKNTAKHLQTHTNVLLHNYNINSKTSTWPRMGSKIKVKFILCAYNSINEVSEWECVHVSLAIHVYNVTLYFARFVFSFCSLCQPKISFDCNCYFWMSAVGWFVHAMRCGLYTKEAPLDFCNCSFEIGGSDERYYTLQSKHLQSINNVTKWKVIVNR